MTAVVVLGACGLLIAVVARWAPVEQGVRRGGREGEDRLELDERP